jgi:hypothetical protein
MQLIQLLLALLTSVIALILIYIAVQQYRKLRLEMFDKRYAIYQSVKEFIRLALQEGNISDDAFFKLNDKTQAALFMFDEDIDNYIDDLQSKGARLRYLNDRLSNQALPIGDQRSSLIAETAELLTWFSKQPIQLKQVFKKYLRVSD